MTAKRTYRLVLAACIATAILPLAAADGAARSKRWETTVTHTYDVGTGISSFQMSPCNITIQYESPGCQIIPVPPGAKYVHIKFADEVTPAVAGVVQAWSENYRKRGEALQVCSETTQPYRVAGVRQIAVGVYQGPCVEASGYTPAGSTKGTITATFSNLP